MCSLYLCTQGLSNGSCSSVEIDRHRKEVSFRFDSIDDGEYVDGSPEKKKTSWLSPRTRKKSRVSAIWDIPVLVLIPNEPQQIKVYFRKDIGVY